MKPGNLLKSKVPNPAKESKDEGENRISFCPSGRALFYARKGTNMNNRKIFTSESVTQGHPDKLCDLVSDSVLDAVLEQDPMGRVACETAATTGMVLVMGEFTDIRAIWICCVLLLISFILMFIRDDQEA